MVEHLVAYFGQRTWRAALQWGIVMGLGTAALAVALFDQDMSVGQALFRVFWWTVVALAFTWWRRRRAGLATPPSA